MSSVLPPTTTDMPGLGRLTPALLYDSIPAIPRSGCNRQTPTGSSTLQLCYHLRFCGHCGTAVTVDSGCDSLGAMQTGHSACSRQCHLFVDDWTAGSAALQENDPCRQRCKVLCCCGGTRQERQTESRFLCVWELTRNRMY